MRESSQKRISFLLVDSEISISQNIARPSLASGFRRAPKRPRLFIWSLYSSFLPSPICVLLFLPSTQNLCTAIQIYFHDCQVKFKFMFVLLFMNVSRAWKHFAYVISGNFVVCIINAAIISDAKKLSTRVIFTRNGISAIIYNRNIVHQEILWRISKYKFISNWKKYLVGNTLSM